MDTSTLHAATEELAATLSEVTRGELGIPVAAPDGDLAGLYSRLLAENLATAAALSGEPAPDAPALDRAALASTADEYGAGFDVEYRRTAALREEAFAAAGGDADPTYAAAVREAEAASRTLADALGLTPRP